jgi:hypothetical protein
MKKQTLYGIIGVVVITLACSFGSETPAAPTQQVDEVGTVVAATMQALLTATGEDSPTQVPTQSSGTPVSLEYASFVIPDGLASGADPEAVPAVGEDSGAPWEAAPAHLKFTLTDYPLQNKFHEPRLFIYPANEFAQAHSGAAEQIERLKKALTGSPLLQETLPIIPFFNAGPLLTANIKIIPFQNGSGVRTLTQYAQYSAPVNNRELFYHFEGLTSDNKYYVIAILPITAPFLQEDEKPEAPLPEGGVPFPANAEPSQTYYISVTEKLNSLAQDAYTPSLNTLDTLIESILVTPP